MRENRVRTLWADDRPVVNGWLAIANSYSAEVMAHEDFDSLTIDMQHGMVDFQAAIAMFQALSTRNCTPLARVAWNDPALIMKSLDAGAYGIICRDGQHAGGMRALCRGLPLRARGLSEFWSGPRHSVRRRRLRGRGQRHGRHPGDD